MAIPIQTNLIALYKACEPPLDAKLGAIFDAFKSGVFI